MYLFVNFKVWLFKVLCPDHIISNFLNNICQAAVSFFLSLCPSSYRFKMLHNRQYNTYEREPKQNWSILVMYQFNFHDNVHQLFLNLVDKKPIGLIKLQNDRTPRSQDATINCKYLGIHRILCKFEWGWRWSFGATVNLYICEGFSVINDGCALYLRMQTTSRNAFQKNCRVATAQGKQGKQGIWFLLFPDRENTGNFSLAQGKILRHRENIFLWHREKFRPRENIWL